MGIVEDHATGGPTGLHRGNAARRRWLSGVVWAAAFVCAAGVVLVAGDILWSVASRGAHGLTANVFVTDSTGIAGGLRNAILGTVDLVFFGVLFTAPLGVLGGVYLGLFSGPRTAGILRFAAEVLAGVPSIVVGYFGYMVMVVEWGFGVSVLAGALSLSIVMLPYVVRSTEAAVRQVPRGQWEGALALGIGPVAAVRSVIWPSAFPGVLTGILLAVSIALGETAPLIYTAGWSNFDPTLQLTKDPVAYLTYVVWTYLNEPYSSAHQLAYTAALLLIGLVLLLLVAARILRRSGEGKASGWTL